MTHRMVLLSDELNQIEFAKKAAAFFASHAEKSSYGDIDPGSFIALRWGLGDDCVLVLKLDEYHVPTNYAQLVRQVPPEPTPPPSIDDDSFF